MTAIQMPPEVCMYAGETYGKGPGEAKDGVTGQETLGPAGQGERDTSASVAASAPSPAMRCPRASPWLGPLSPPGALPLLALLARQSWRMSSEKLLPSPEAVPCSPAPYLCQVVGKEPGLAPLYNPAPGPQSSTHWIPDKCSFLLSRSVPPPVVFSKGLSRRC